MKLESIYTEVLKVENAIKNNYTAAAVTLLETLRAELENELKHEANARSGKKAIERAALAILKAAGNARPVLMKANRNADGRKKDTKNTLFYLQVRLIQLANFHM